MSKREVMPETAAFVDAFRDVFGAEGINASIKKGMAGLPGFFYAKENGHEVGTPAPPARIEISAADMQLGPFNPPNRKAENEKSALAGRQRKEMK